ncbi:hypothetical protein [Micromonospora echinofusca]|uniref:hypothetical protein n=1 Tax=Micromonospora echinofusca TaxID=47858 RepID=UPI0033EFD0FB
MTHRVSTNDDHRRIVPGRASAAGGRTPGRQAGRRAAHPARTAPGQAAAAPGRPAAAPGRAPVTCR